MYLCRYSVPTGLEDVSRYVELVSALYASGKWSIEELKKLVGLNFLRVYTEVEKVIYFSLFLKFFGGTTKRRLVKKRSRKGVL